MKLKALLEDEDNVIVHLYWLNREEHRKLIDKGYRVDPVVGYHETDGYRAILFG